jgi:septal ring factor EnvC (AmiA/AmiB activator)
VDSVVLGLCIAAGVPVVAVALALAHKTFERMLESQEKRLEMKLRVQQDQDSSLKEQMVALRSEIASLRDTSTQYDMALDRTLQGLTDRMQAMEQGGRRPFPAAPAQPEEQVQRLGQS